MIYTCVYIFAKRGVFQALVEKHFPAPNRRKVNDLLGKAGHKVADSLLDDLMLAPAPQASSSNSSHSKRKPGK